MAGGRWRAAQRRKRWTDHAVLLPEGTLHSLEPWPALQPFASQLAAFGHQPSIHTQLALVKSLGNDLLAVLQLSLEEVEVALRACVELLFLEHSRPLHRGLLSTLSRVPPHHIGQLQDAFMECCQEYGPRGKKLRRFSVVSVSTSLAGLPQPGVIKDVARVCASSLSYSLCLDVQSVLQHALDGGRPTPTDMEECQDALSSMYYFLQQFPEEFDDSQFLQSTSCEEEGLHCRSGGKRSEQVEVPEKSSSYANANNWEYLESKDEEKITETHGSANFKTPGAEEGRSISLNEGGLYGAIVCCLLDVLQAAVLSRDCSVAAGVGLAAAAQLSSSEEGLALVLASAAFTSTSYAYAVLSPDDGLTDATSERGILETAIRCTRKSCLRAEVQKLSDFGKLCFFRGILTAIPRTVQNVHLLCTTGVEKCSESEVESYKQENFGQKEPQRQAWTLLYDGILPALCRFCQSSVDSHFKFHAFTAMQICLQQMKTSICGNLTLSSFNHFEQSLIRLNGSVLPYDPLPVEIISQVLELIWNNWEDPLTQTVKQVQVVFDLVVDVQLVHKRDRYGIRLVEKESLNSGDITKSNVDKVRSDAFLQKIATDLLSAGRYRKGKYAPLSSLVLRIGARSMLLMSPNLLFETIGAFRDDDICSSASTFLKTFLERLKEDSWREEGVNEGIIFARRSWIPPLLSGLLTGYPGLRNNLTTYALPVAMQTDCDSLPVMLAYILDGYGKAGDSPGSSLTWEELKGARGLPELLTVEQQAILLISVLKVARSLALVDGSIGQKLTAAHEMDLTDEENSEVKPIMTGCSLLVSDAVLHIKDQPVEFPISLLLLALTHKDDGLRVDSSELVCLNPKTASMPSPLELCLLRIALPLNMRCSSTAFRMRWTSFLRKFFHRVRSAVEKLQKTENLRISQLKKRELLSGEHGGLIDQESECLESLTGITESAVTLEQMQEFLQWLSQMFVSSLYPSASYERKTMAMEIFNALLEVWSLKQLWEKRPGRRRSSLNLDTLDFSPYHNILFSESYTMVVVGALVDSWDRLREAAYRILIQYPTPLPGLDSERNVEELLTWAKSMVNSPRVRESDAGALAFRLIFRKYVVELGWSVKVHPVPKVVNKSSTGAYSNCEPGSGGTVQYLESLSDWLQWGIEEGQKDLLKACTHSFVHGVLLVLRYSVDEIDWTSSGTRLCSEDIRAVLARLLSLLLRVTSLALWVVSADALNLHEQQGGSSFPGGMISETDHVEFNFMAADCGGDINGYSSFSEEYVAPPEQMVMVGCWLSVKEVSLLLGTMARVVPLPGSPGISKADRWRNDTQTGQSSPETLKSSPLLDGKQLEAIGSHFVQVLLSMKHNGAIDKTRTGFIALCDRLLRSSDPWLNKLPELWLQEVMDHTGARGQVVDDLLRRSAGIPPAFLGLFLGEPDGSPKKLLPIAMRWLLDTCKGFLVKSRCQNLEITGEMELSKMKRGLKEPILPVHGIPEDVLAGLKEDGRPLPLKSRNEGVVPTVHAFNVLRMAFHNTTLATDTSGFCAEGLITAIQAFSSSHWEVRNSATLTFTALVHRTIGFLNVFKRESARHAITGFEFFHRYPTLHPFLLKELQSATQQLEHGPSNGSNAESARGSVFHPSLFPVLVILSRLKPSFISGDVEDWLNPSAFIPYVSQCATEQNLHVRVLASQALAPLVSAKDLSVVLLQLIQSLPLSVSGRGQDPAATEQKVEFNRINSDTNGPRLTAAHEAHSFNSMHGILLQICTLLSSNCISLLDLDQLCRIITHVSQAVEERLWLGSIRFCGCSMVIGSFLDMLGGLLSLAQLCKEKISNPESLMHQLEALICELSCECLDDLTDDSQDSTRVGLREKAAKLYFQTMVTRGSFPSNLMSDVDLKDKAAAIGPISRSTNGKPGLEAGGTEGSSHSGSQDFGHFVTRLKQSLRDRSYEVRLVTLKVLKKLCDLQCEQEKLIKGPRRQIDNFARDYGFLRPLIIQRLGVETHSLCVYRILQVIYSWTLIDRGGNGPSVASQKSQTHTIQDIESVWGSGLSSQELWYSLLKIYRTSKEMKTKEAALRCLGGCLQYITVGIVNIIKYTSLSEGSRGLSQNHSFVDGSEHGIPQFKCASNGVVMKDISRSKAAVSIWLDIAKVHSAASEAVKFRRATAEAIVASGILEHAKWIGRKLMEDSQGDGLIRASNDPLGTTSLEWYARAVLSAWCICIKFLEDEDLDLRQKLALSILHVVTRAGSLTNDVVASQVEKVIQVSFEFLSSQFSEWKVYYEILAEWVLRSDDNVSSISGDVNFIRRLFNKEIDNHHGEELLFVQLCCLHLEKFVKASGKAAVGSDKGHSNLWLDSSCNSDVHQPSSSTPLVDGRQCPKGMSASSWYDTFLWTWRMKYLEQARASAQLSLAINTKMQWVGGVTNQEETFKSLYRSLLGLLTFVGSGRMKSSDTRTDCPHEEFVCGLAEVSGVLRQLPLNPLVSNTLVQVLQAYEQQLQVTLGSLEIRAELKLAYSESFSPLFLIS